MQLTKSLEPKRPAISCWLILLWFAHNQFAYTLKTVARSLYNYYTTSRYATKIIKRHGMALDLCHICETSIVARSTSIFCQSCNVIISDNYTQLYQEFYNTTKIWCSYTYLIMHGPDGCHIRWMICYRVYRMMMANPAPSSLFLALSIPSIISDDLIGHQL